MTDLSTFGLVESRGPPEPPAPCSTTNIYTKSTNLVVTPTEESQTRPDRTILITRNHPPKPITSWQRAWTVAMETRQRYPAVWIVSNGSMDTPATEWWIRGVVEATN